MSSHSTGRLSRALVIVPATLAVLATFGMRAAAQEQPAPKWELFGGYSFWYPGSDLHGVLPFGTQPVSSRLESNPRGAGLAVTYNFNRWLGLTLDTSTHWGSGEAGLFNKIDDAALSTLSIGPKLTFRHEHFSPFVEVLVGDHRLMPDAFYDVDKLGVIAGGGLDINFNRHVALRLIRADYLHSFNYRYGPANVSPETGLQSLRLQAGLNFMWGGGPPPAPASAACSAEPVEVFPGEPVTAHVTGSGFNPKRTLKYNWTGTGVKITGAETASPQIDTTGLQPGSYEVSANLSDGSKRGLASCSTKFTVKQPQPPQISCSADPATVKTRETSTIRANANSPDNRKLTYSYSATAGQISGADSTATLNTTGAEPGQITVTCNVSDDRNPPLTASATTTVTVEAPPPPPPVGPPPEMKELEQRLALHSIYFPTAQPTAKNPKGGLTPSQQEALTSLANDFKRYLTYKPEAHLILSGYADERGSAEYNKALTERRVERTKSFLVEQGVPEFAIEIRAFGKEKNLTAAEVKEQMNQNPDLTPEERQRLLRNLRVIVLANNRRVDVSLTTTGQESVRRYPFNARDALALISPKAGEPGKGKKPATRRKPAPKKP